MILDFWFLDALAQVAFRRLFHNIQSKTLSNLIVSLLPNFFSLLEHFFAGETNSISVVVSAKKKHNWRGLGVSESRTLGVSEPRRSVSNVRKQCQTPVLYHSAPDDRSLPRNRDGLPRGSRIQPSLRPPPFMSCRIA